MSTPTLGGNVVIRNGDELDFCWRECIQSLLPVCDVVSVCDGESTDGTLEAVREWSKTEPKIRLCIWPWPNPKGDADFFVKWINFNREQLDTEWQIQIDADEVLYEDSYDEVIDFIKKKKGRTGVVTRHTFWKDHKHTLKEGICLGRRVVRIAEQRLWLASDGFHPMGAEAARLGFPTTAEIFHVGFIRKPEQFFKKEERLQGYFFDTYDQRLRDASQRLDEYEKKSDWMGDRRVAHYVDHLDPYNGGYPEVLKKWLRDRGYEC